jgi:hypothetical protein
MSLFLPFLSALCVLISAAISANYDQDEFHVKLQNKQTTAFILLNEIPEAAKKVVVTVRDYSAQEFSVSLCSKEVRKLAQNDKFVRVIPEFEVVMPTSTFLFGREFTTQYKKNLHIKLCDSNGILQKVVTKNLL